MFLGKRFVASTAVVGLFVSLGLSGCGDGDAADLVEESPETTDPTSASPSPTPSPQKPVRLAWYTAPSNGSHNSVQSAVVQECVKASQGRYSIEVNQLPADYNEQQARLETALAAGGLIDLMSVDVSLLGRFVDRRQLAALPATDQRRLRETVLGGPLAANTVYGDVVAFPMYANTQLLWYRKSAAKRAKLDLARPVTWDRLIAAAEAAKTSVQVQARRYEGYVVWLNALIAGAGGDVRRPDSRAGRVAARVIRQLATSRAGDPKLNKTTELETQRRFLAGRAGFMLNWPYVWSLTGQRWKHGDLGWAMYPRTEPDRPAAPPIGGVSVAVPASSTHQELALEAARCLTSPEHQARLVTESGGFLAPTASVYNDPKVRRAYPMADLLRESLQRGVPRPVVGGYQDISRALLKTFWPPDRVDPATTPKQAQRAIDAALP
ncbi:MAG TPA: extracellular solute-binding protein [Nocardioidaceae bacterium]|nr:extracellular solute-binding protein [Nocardioidaceae bacterium]